VVTHHAPVNWTVNNKGKVSEAYVNKIADSLFKKAAPAKVVHHTLPHAEKK
jgi:hypothetical protein